MGWRRRARVAFIVRFDVKVACDAKWAIAEAQSSFNTLMEADEGSETCRLVAEGGEEVEELRQVSRKIGGGEPAVTMEHK
jgi:hypothetical protein